MWRPKKHSDCNIEKVRQSYKLWNMTKSEAEVLKSRKKRKNNKLVGNVQRLAKHTDKEVWKKRKKKKLV